MIIIISEILLYIKIDTKYIIYHKISNNLFLIFILIASQQILPNLILNTTSAIKYKKTSCSLLIIIYKQALLFIINFIITYI